MNAQRPAPMSFADQVGFVVFIVGVALSGLAYYVLGGPEVRREMREDWRKS